MISTEDEFRGMEEAIYPDKARVRAKVNKILNEYDGKDHVQLLGIIKEMIDDEKKK